MDEAKICPHCKIEKSISDYHKDKKNKDGLASSCKDCRNKMAQSWYHNLVAKKWNKQHIERARKNQLKAKYNITIEDYDKMFMQQNGVCAVCGKTESSKNQYGLRRLSVDHNHKTGKVRGLLCAKCNQAIGLFDDNVDYLLNAVEYLRSKLCDTESI